MFTRTLKNRYIGYANVTTKQLLTQLFTTYGKITGNGLWQNSIKMNTVYDTNLPTEALSDQVEDGMYHANTWRHSKTKGQVVVTEN